MKYFVIVTILATLLQQSGANELQDLQQSKMLNLIQRGWEFGWQYYMTGQPPSYHEEVTETKFLLWTKTHSDKPYLLDAFVNTSIGSSPMDFRRPTFVIFHGYADDGSTDWIINTKNALLTKVDCNVISVDHGQMVRSPRYVRAVYNSYEVANYSASFFDWLQSSYHLDLKSVHIIGHSLGAHTAGMTGYYMKSGKVARVTGLDPSGPLYYNQASNLTLSKGSGDFVDIIHTNGGNIITGSYGLLKPLGHVDFYPNGGSEQPECPKINITLGHIGGIENCSHRRSVLYWIESILAVEPQDIPFVSWKCSDYETFEKGNCFSCENGCQKMGFPAVADYPGTYYLHVYSESPFAMGAIDSISSHTVLYNPNYFLVILAAVISSSFRSIV